MSGYRIKKQISISIVASIFLAQQSLYALPSGGKFTHGSGGTITSGNGSMDITGIKGTGGKGNNYVINWGGGFGINKGEDVNFHNKTKGTGGGTFLNIDLKGKTSQINGDLNANGNNIFIINPAGMTIGKDGAINGANQFGFSSMALNASQITAFANNSDESKNYNFFYPSNFKQNKGDLVNLGTIEANNIYLVGNKVELGKVKNVNGGNTQVDIDGNYVYVNVGKLNENGILTQGKLKVNANARKMGYLEDTMTNFYTEGKSYTFFEDNIIQTTNNGEAGAKWDKALTVENATEWNYFADVWNGDREANTTILDKIAVVRLIDNIDFGNTITKTVGINDRAFTGIFDGNGKTLFNLNLATQTNKDGLTYTGLFGIVNQNAYIANFYVYGVKFTGKVQLGGTVVARMMGGTIDNVHVDGRNGILKASAGDSKSTALGGLIGEISASNNVTIKNSSVKNFQEISVTGTGENRKWPTTSVGGFVGNAYVEQNTKVSFENSLVQNIQNIKLTSDASEAEIGAGGFMGTATGWANGAMSFKNIEVQDLGNISATMGEMTYGVGVGGFIGVLNRNASFENIYVNIDGVIEARKDKDMPESATIDTFVLAGGFIGKVAGGTSIDKMNDVKIVLEQNAKIKAYTELRHPFSYAGAGGFIGGAFNFGKDGTSEPALAMLNVEESKNLDIEYKGGNFSNAIEATTYFVGNYVPDGDKYKYESEGMFIGIFEDTSNIQYNYKGNSQGIDTDNSYEMRSDKFTRIQKGLSIGDPDYYKPVNNGNSVIVPPTQIKLDNSDYAGVEESIKDIFDEFKNSGYELDLNTNDGVITFYYKGDKNTKIEISLSDLEGKDFVGFVNALKGKVKDLGNEEFNSLYQTLDFISAVASNGNVGDKDNVDNTRPDYENTIHYSLKNSSSNYKNGGKALGEYTTKLASLLSYVDGMQEDLKNNKELQEEFIKNWGGNSLEEAYKNYVSFYEAFNNKYGALEDAYKAIENEYLSVTERLRQAYKNYQENQTGANEAELIFAAEAYNSFMKANGDTILALEEPAYKSGANKINNTHAFLKNKLGASYASIENGLKGIDFSGNGKDGKYDSADNGYFANSSGSLTIFADFATKDSKGTRATLTLPDTSDLDGINPPRPSLPDTDLIEDERGSVLVLKEEDEEKDVIEQEEIEYTDGQEGGSLCIVSDGFTTHNPCSAGRI